MEETYHTKAIILDRSPWKDDGTRVAMYTLDRGRLDLIARGTRKISSKLSAHIEPITFSRIMAIRGRQYDYVGSAISENCFFDIKNNLDKLNSAGKILNTFNRLIKEGEKDEKLFNLLNDSLMALNDHRLSFSHGLFTSFFSLKLITLLGYKPEFYNCAVCKNKIFPGGNLFDFKKCGVVCAKHKNSPVRGSEWIQLNNLERFGIASRSTELTVSDDCIKVLRTIMENDIENFRRLKVGEALEKEIIKIVDLFLSYNFNIN